MSTADNLNATVYTSPAQSDIFPAEQQPIEANLETHEIVSDEVRLLESHGTRLYHGRVKILGAGAIARYTLETPHGSHDEVPFILVNGFCGFKSSYAGLRHEMALDGKPTATLQPVRLQELKHMIHPDHILHPELVQSMTVGTVVTALQNNHGYEQFDIGGHSWGGPVAAHMIERAPENIRSLSLIAAAGLDGHKLSDIIRRLPRELTQDILPYGINRLRAGDTRSVLSVLKHALINPGRTGLEGLAAATADIRPAVKRLGKMGIATYGIQYASDEFFHIDLVRKYCHDILDEIIEHPDPHMGHLGPQRDPKGTAKLINENLRTQFN